MSNRERVKKCLREVMDPSFEEERDLISGGWIDSFTLLRLVGSLEDEFKVKLELQEVIPETFNDVDSLLEMIEAYL